MQSLFLKQFLLIKKTMKKVVSPVDVFGAEKFFD